MSDATMSVKQIESKEYNPFEGLQDAVNIFTGLADYLSLWCEMYGLREDEICYTPSEWRTPLMTTFRIFRTDGRPISPKAYDPRLPNVSQVFLRRGHRITRFVAMQPGFRRQMFDVDQDLRACLDAHGLKAAEVEIISRWDGDGKVILKVIPRVSAAERTGREYLTHYRHD